MAQINLLSDDVIDKIAAGEVVESPAAVVKELIENALDAKAERIIIEIKGGGHQLIRVDDDGIGMDEEDAILSLKRHTTSKITSAHDLFALQTMGFRGEALASIAAVSKLSLMTCNEMCGVHVLVEGGKILRVEPTAREKGTSIEVRSLFYNTPARKQFQKSAAASLAEIIRLVMAIALSHPEKHFELISQEGSVLKAFKGDVDDPEKLLGLRVKAVLGDTFFSQATWTKIKEAPYEIFGFVGKPHFVRQNRLGQYLFINQRWIQSPFLSMAVREAYGTYIKEGSYPHFVLFFNIPKDHVDVNVHPQKKEVRLKEQAFLKGQILKVIANTFHTPMVSLNEVPVFTPTAFALREEPSFSPNYTAQMPLWDVEEAPAKTLEIISMVGFYLLAKGTLQDHNVISSSEGLLLIDLKAAYARLLYESLEKENNQASQSVLIPITMQIDRGSKLLFEEHLNDLEQMGFQIRFISEEMIAIDGYPAAFREKDVKDFILELIHENPTGFTERRFAVFASRFARGRKTPFLKDEAKALLDTLLKSEVPLFCPLGKPIMIALGEEELGKLLK